MRICGKWQICIFWAAGWVRPVRALACKWYITSPLSTSNISVYWLSGRWAAVSRGFCFRCRLVANSADGRTLVSLRFLCGSDVSQDDILDKDDTARLLEDANWGRFGQTGVAEGVEIWAIFRQRKIGRSWKCYPSSHFVGCFCWSTSDPLSLLFQGVPLASCLEKCSLHPSCRCRLTRSLSSAVQLPRCSFPPFCAISHQLPSSNFDFLIGQLHFGTGSLVAWDLINAGVPVSKSGKRRDDNRWLVAVHGCTGTR